MLGSSIGFALDDCLIRFYPTLDIIRFDGQHFLQGISCAVCFQRPHFHLAKALTTKLSLTTQRLLGNQAVWAG